MRRENGQLDLALPVRYTWGGKRPGAGRKKSGRPVGVPHRRRAFHDRNHPVHVTLRVRRDLPSLRDWRVARAIGQAIRAATAAGRPGFRVLHFSVQPDHLHLVVEAGGKAALSRGLQGLLSRIARRVNRDLGRRGPVFADRYHARPLASPREVRHAIVYVLCNWKKHVGDAAGVDPLSSGRWFDGWRAKVPVPDTPSPVARPRTWLARAGWRRHGLLSESDRPKG